MVTQSCLPWPALSSGQIPAGGYTGNGRRLPARPALLFMSSPVAMTTGCGAGYVGWPLRTKRREVLRVASRNT
jgi:hypothetical protein